MDTGRRWKAHAAVHGVGKESDTTELLNKTRSINNWLVDDGNAQIHENAKKKKKNILYLTTHHLKWELE